MPVLLKFTLVSLLLNLPSLIATAEEPRSAWTIGSPSHLQAVGKLQVPTVKIESGRRRHHIEDCSATLVALPGQAEANTIVSAWHCLEYYSDLSRPISFVLAANGSEQLRTTALRVADGGHISEDWAVLRLKEAVPSEQARPMVVNFQSPDASRAITMAGYSGDSGVGNHGEQLSYHANCHILNMQRALVSTDCLAFKGASGGAVTQADARSGQTLLTGVISQGDGSSTSLFVPTTRFAPALRAALGAAQ